jgi:hypothetical protein
MTRSPGLYFSRISSISVVERAFSGFAAVYMSSKVTTVALCLVSRTEARHDGQVNRTSSGAGGLGDRSIFAFWKLNHSFRHAPQNVCRQSSSVNGW